MHKKLEALLKKLGIKQETLDLFVDDTKKDELEKLDVEKVLEGVTDAFKNRFENDEAFLNPIKESVRGEILSSKHRKLLKLVELSEDELKDIPDKTKFDSTLELAIEKLKNAKADPKTSNEELKTLNEEIKNLKATIKKYDEEDIPKIRSEVEAEKNNLHIRQFAMKHLAEKKLLGKQDFILEGVLREAQNSMVLKLDDKGIPTPKQKDNPDLDLFDKENNTAVKFDSWMDKFLDDNGLVQKSNAEPTPKPGEPNPTGGEPKFNLPGLAKAQALAGKQD